MVSGAWSFSHFIISANTLVSPITSFCSPFFYQSGSTLLCSATNLDSVNIRGATLLGEAVWRSFGGQSYGSCSEAGLVASNSGVEAAWDSDSYRVRIQPE
jgi:hypothetical protein